MKELLKMWTIKDAIFTVCDASENIPSSMLRLSWMKILGQGYNDQENLEDGDIEACLALTKFGTKEVYIQMSQAKEAFDVLL